MTGASSSRPFRALVGLGAFVAVALSAWHYGTEVASAPPTTFDDSYMFVRYAKHILAGHGPAWNPGGEPTYGVSNLLYVLVVTVLRWGTDLTDAGLLRVASTGFGIAAIVTMVATAARFATAAPLSGNLALWAGLLAPALLLSDIFVYHSLTGMDTTLSLFLHTALIWVTLRLVERGTRRALWPVVLVAYLAFLARHDSVFYAVFFPAAAILFLSGAPHRTRLLLSFWVGLGVVLVVDAGVKYAVFGVPVPLPLYAKMYGHYREYAGFGLWNPVEYLLEFWVTVMPFACVAVAFVGRRSLPLLLVFLAPAAVTLVSYFGVVQIMGFRARFSFPSLPFFVMAGALCFDRFVARSRELTAEGGAGGLALASRLMAVLAIVVVTPVARTLIRPRPEQRLLAKAPVQNPGALPQLSYWDAVAGMTTIARGAPAGSVFCMSEYGRIGSEAPELEIYDPLGLHDERTAREGFSAEALFEHEPDLIWLPHPDYVAMRREILTSEELRSGYDVYPGALRFGVAIRRAGPHADELNRLFAEVWRRCYPGVAMEANRSARD